MVKQTLKRRLRQNCHEAVFRIEWIITTSAKHGWGDWRSPVANRTNSQLPFRHERCQVADTVNVAPLVVVP